MSKQTREEEKKILAQMDEAMQEQKEEKPKTPSFSGSQPTEVHCRRCRTLMENGVCPTCGFKTYVPMSEEKRKKIKTVTTVIGFVVFIILFLVLQMTKK